MILLIRYRDEAGTLSERKISEFSLGDHGTIRAFCHLRNAERTFVLSRIDYAVDPDTGEQVDIRKELGLPSLPQVLGSAIPKFSRLSVSMSIVQAKRQRNKDKYDLYKPFVLPVLSNWAKRRLIGLFSERCFACGHAGKLVIDHHVPQALSGRLVPGNLCVLCSMCNGRKLDKAPEDFYTKDKIERIIPLLEKQIELFDFRFNRERWRAEPRAYLASIGISQDLIEQVLTDEMHPLYSGIPDSNSFTIVINAT